MESFHCKIVHGPRRGGGNIFFWCLHFLSDCAYWPKNFHSNIMNPLDDNKYSYFKQIIPRATAALIFYMRSHPHSLYYSKSMEIKHKADYDNTKLLLFFVHILFFIFMYWTIDSQTVIRITMFSFFRSK